MICSEDVAGMEVEESIHLFGKSVRKRQLGRLRLRWKDNMKQTVWVGLKLLII
jgi:hypothetical protein